MAKRYGKERPGRKEEVRKRRGQRIKQYIRENKDAAQLEMEEMMRIADTTYYTVMPYYMTNAAKNIERGLRQERGVSDLLEEFRAQGPRPVLIISGGPSLEVNHLLRHVAEVYKERRFAIVAVDAVLEKLCKLSLFPDYVISADVQEETLNFYLCVKDYEEKLRAAGTRAILAGTTDPKVVDAIGDMPRFWYWPVARFGKHMDAGSMWNYMVPLGKVNPHGHVTGAALSIFGALNPGIALIGADYSYAPGEGYKETFWYRWLAARGRTHDEIMADLKPREYDDRVAGGRVMTDVVWMHYVTYMLNWLDALEPKLKVVNCSGRGLFFHPQLVPPATLESFIEYAQTGAGAGDGEEDSDVRGGPAASDG